MAIIRPFQAVMPPASRAAEVADPPYDVVSKEEAVALAAERPFGFLRVGRAELELPDGADPYSEVVYRKAAENYRRLCASVPLQADDLPHFYVYSLTVGGRCQSGIVAAAAVDDYDAGIIRKHEKTRKSKEDDRTRHIMALRSQTGPVFLVHRDSPAVTAVAEQSMAGAPLFEFTSSDGVSHAGWRVPGAREQALQAAFSAMGELYIADGHHRAAGASRARAMLRDANCRHDGSEEYNGMLSVIFPSSHVRILPYNRVVSDLNGLSRDSFLDAVSSTFVVELSTSPLPAEPTHIHMYAFGQWRRLRYRGDVSRLPPTAALDVSLLQDKLLSPILGIGDPSTSPKLDFVGGIRGAEALEHMVNEGGAAAAFSMFPTTIEQLMAIADEGGVMPPKSTWFEPKLRDGLFSHDI